MNSEFGLSQLDRTENLDPVVEFVQGYQGFLRNGQAEKTSTSIKELTKEDLSQDQTLYNRLIEAYTYTFAQTPWGALLDSENNLVPIDAITKEDGTLLPSINTKEYSLLYSREDIEEQFKNWMNEDKVLITTTAKRNGYDYIIDTFGIVTLTENPTSTAETIVSENNEERWNETEKEELLNSIERYQNRLPDTGLAYWNDVASVSYKNSSKREANSVKSMKQFVLSLKDLFHTKNWSNQKPENLILIWRTKKDPTSPMYLITKRLTKELFVEKREEAEYGIYGMSVEKFDQYKDSKDILKGLRVINKNR
jgi:hypothetical protein